MRRSRLGRAALLITLLFGTALTLGSCGGASQEELDRARSEGAAEAKRNQDLAEQKRKQRELEEKIAKLEKQRTDSGGTPSPPPSAPSSESGENASCGSGLSVGPRTTCAFAENVRSAWLNAGGGSVTVDVYSPVTNRSYVMRCSAGVTTTCRGGNNAAVFIR